MPKPKQQRWLAPIYFHQGQFPRLTAELAAHGALPVDGLLADLGVSARTSLIRRSAASPPASMARWICAWTRMADLTAAEYSHEY